MNKKGFFSAIVCFLLSFTLVSCVSSSNIKSKNPQTKLPSADSCVYINKNQVMDISGALQFNVMQCNKVTIAAGVDSVTINNFPHITPNSLIVITPQSPHSEGFYQYWVEPSNGSFSVNIEPTSSKPWTFNFFISRY